MTPVQRIVVSVVGALIIVVLLVGIWVGINARAGKTVYEEAIQAKQSLTYAQVAVGAQDFDRAAKDLDEGLEHLQTAQTLFKRFQVLRIIPGVSRQIKAVDGLIDASINLTTGLAALTEVGKKVNEVLTVQGEEVSFADINPEQKREVLKALSESTVELQSVKSQIELAVLSIEQIPDSGLLTPVQEAVDPLKEQLPLLESIITQAIPAAETLPAILGYPNEKTYLFLLQNNRELRPTGGFIGTYGVLKLDSGEIVSFSTDNVYNLDNPAKDIVTEPSPTPIAQHTSTQNWLFRNINWSPDFPTTAKKAEEKYHEQGGPEANFDGVIAVTPTFIESLIDITGPISVDGLEFTSENLFEQLEHQVEFAYSEQGKSDADRKEIIGDMADMIMDKIFHLPKSEFPVLWTTFIKNVDQKQILIYSDDQLTQQLVLKQNWAGEMKPYTGDYLAFIDANLAALKTDNVMERTLDYAVTQENGEYYGNASMLYKNTGWFDGFHTRYRTYTRIYLPYGAELVESKGFFTGDKLQNGRPTEPDVYDESFERPDGSIVRYSVVGGFTSIEPQQEGTIELKYKLPESVVKQIEQKNYTLYIQKQAGTLAHTLHLQFDIGRKIKSGTPLDLFHKIGENTVSIDSDLSIDRTFSFSID